ncbi:hypothetical protein PVL29_004615 [Vitis rotundifolia]|uniref:Uncharacterized protein n=1 Tax=Vitis rotundifolia TaxID=103349 RepID=A0AA39A9J1_VITRO|nr:hypothetical protein PVL29_004615 [Vitis rotundifolia]
MGQVPKPLMIVLLTLIVCSCSQALQNLRQSHGGSDPIHHDMEDAMKREAYGIYQESEKGSDPIHRKMEDQIGRGSADPIHQKIKGHMGTNTYKIYRKVPTVPNPIHN